MAITNSTIAQAVNDLVDYWDSFNVEYAAWLSGTVGGGPNLDGEYPLTDYLGNVTLTLCPAALEASVTGVVDSASVYAAAAQAAQAAAEAAQTAAELAETNTDVSEAQALAYRDAALAAQTAAESARTTAIAQAGVSTLNAGYASEWAITVEDTLVSVAAGGNGTTDYSALHWAAKSAADAVATAADVVSTNADVVITNADVTYSAEWANKPHGVLVSAAAGGDQVDDYSALHWATEAATFNPALYSLVGHTHSYADIADHQTNKLMGRSTAGTGAAEMISVGQALSLTAGSLQVDLGTAGGQAAAGNHVHEGTAIDATAVTAGFVLTADGAGNAAWAAAAGGAGAYLADGSVALTADLNMNSYGVDCGALYLDVKSNAASPGGIRFQDSLSATKGYVYWDASSIGLLTSGGAWALAIAHSTKAMTTYGDAIIGGDVLINGAGNELTMKSTAPKLKWNETDAPVDEKIWDMVTVAGLMRFRMIDDTDAASTNWLTIDRTGYASALITAPATTSLDILGTMAARYGINGDYASTGAAGTWGATIWSLDTAFDGGEAGNNSIDTGLYGIKWKRSSHANANAYVGEGLYVHANSTFYGGIGTGGAVAAKYTVNTGGQYPNIIGVSNAYARISTPYGYCDVGPNNGSFSHFNTDIAQFYFNKPVQINGQPSRYNYGAIPYHASASYSVCSITFSTASPSGGSSGSIWYKYV